MNDDLSNYFDLFHNIGLINSETKREYDKAFKTNIDYYTPQQIKDIRKKSNMSQYDFSLHLNVSVSTLQKWESGKTKPKGSALKLLNIVDKNGSNILL